MYYKFYLLLIVVNHCKMFWKPIYLDKFLLMFFFKIYQNLIERYFKRYLTSECSSLFIAYCLLVWSSIVSKFKMQCSIALHRYSSPSFIHLHTGKNKKNTAMITMIKFFFPDLTTDIDLTSIDGVDQTQMLLNNGESARSKIILNIYDLERPSTIYGIV